MTKVIKIVRTKLAVQPAAAHRLAAKAAAARLAASKAKAKPAAKPATSPTITAATEVSDARLLQLMRNPTFTTAFPFLGAALTKITSKKSGCGKCGRKNRKVSVDLNAVKQNLANMPAAQKAQFRSMLSTRQVVIKYVKPNGQLTRLSF